MWLKVPDNKLRDIQPPPLNPASLLAIGAAKRHWEVARFRSKLN
jgi:hypothetical protein